MQMGMAIQDLLDQASSPELMAPVVFVALFASVVYVLWKGRNVLRDGIVSLFFLPYTVWLRVSGKWKVWRARRELQMQRARLLALKERAAGALIDWLQHEVSTGGMTLQESYDLQMLLARNIAYPALQPAYDPEFVKTQIKARRAQGQNRPVKLPDLTKRGRFSAMLNGTK